MFTITHRFSSAQIVTPQWLLDCCEKGDIVPEMNYAATTVERDEK